MILGNYRDFFVAIAEAAATLTGLLFVAISIRKRADTSAHSAVVQEIRAAAALLALTSALAVSVFGLVPGNNAGYPAAVVGTIGIFFTAAGMRSILASTRDYRLLWRQGELVLLLFLTFGFELGSGIALIANGHSRGALMTLSNVLAASLLIGVARAWELVGDRPTGLVASIAILSGHGGPPAAGRGPSAVEPQGSDGPPGVPDLPCP